jgi:two-component system, OmpR family, response regulator MprA
MLRYLFRGVDRLPRLFRRHVADGGRRQQAGVEAQEALPSRVAAPTGGSTLRILVVDDDPIGSKLVKFLLSEQGGYQVEPVDNARGALALIERHPPDLVVLDIMLPGMDGLEVARRLRSAGESVPILMLTARDAVPNRVEGFEAGADDYLVKPFAPEELLARVKALLRRSQGERSQMRVGGLKIDVASMQVTLPDHRRVPLAPTAMKLLLALAQHPGQAVSREELMDHVWGETYVGESNIVDVYIGRLRRKLERDPAHPKYIFTVHGVGYKVVEG